MKRYLLAIAVLMLVLVPARAQEQPDPPRPDEQRPQLIKVSDREAIAAAMGRDVIIEGTVESAQWSDTGKVMNIEFADAVEPKLLVVLFERSRKRFDEAFAGDLSKAITGKTIRVKGRLQRYGGYVEAFKDRPQIIMDHTSQLTIMPDEPQDGEEADTPDGRDEPKSQEQSN